MSKHMCSGSPVLIYQVQVLQNARALFLLLCACSFASLRPNFGRARFARCIKWHFTARLQQPDHFFNLCEGKVERLQMEGFERQNDRAAYRSYPTTNTTTHESHFKSTKRVQMGSTQNLVKSNQIETERSANERTVGIQDGRISAQTNGVNLTSEEETFAEEEEEVEEDAAKDCCSWLDSEQKGLQCART